MGRRPGPKDRERALRIAAEFVARARAVDTAAALADLLGEATRQLGFERFALVHHADMRRAPPGAIRLDNYPAEWASRFVEGGLWAIDPIHQASLRTSLVFDWHELGGLLRLTRQHKEILSAGTRAGLRSGLTVPVHVPGERSGTCSFVSGRDLAFGDDARLGAQLVGSFAFECARRLAGGARLSLARLTARQRDCLLLAAQGKSDWEIGRILGLHEETVTKYMNAARRRYGVSRRVQLSIAAIFDGEISFAEVVRR